MPLNFPKHLTIGSTEWKIQPFKFDIEKINGGYSPSYKDVVLSGVSPLSLPNAQAKGLKYIKLFGKCKQTSRNLFDKNKIKYNYYLNSSGNEVSSTSWCISDFIEVSPSNQYIMSGTTNYGSNPKKCYYNESKTFISSDSLNDEPFYPVANAKYIKISVYKSSLSTFQFEQGSSATSYTPFVPTPTLTDRIDIICNNGIVGRSSGGTTETVSMNTQTSTAQDLLSCGNDYIDEQNITTGEITRKVGVYVFDGTENIQASTTNNVYRVEDVINDNDYTSSTPACICSHFVGTPPSVGVSAMTDGSIKVGYKSAVFYHTIYICLADTDAASLKSFFAQQYASGTPVIIVYPLATPTTETVTPQTNIQTVAGNNTLTITQSSVDGLEMEVKYSAGVEVEIEG